MPSIIMESKFREQSVVPNKGGVSRAKLNFISFIV